MSIPKQFLAAAALLVAVPTISAAQEADPMVVELTEEKVDHYLALGSRAAGFFFNGQVDSVLAMVTPAFALEMGGRSAMEAQMIQTQEQLGLPTEVLVEKVGLRDGKVEFWWEAAFSNLLGEPFVMRLQFDEYDLIAFGDISPKSGAPALPES